MTDPFPSQERHALGSLFGTYLAKVVSVEDTANLARVKVRLLSAPEGAADQDVALWARVAVPFSGDGWGAFFLPDKGDEVAVVFVGGDPRQPLVVGSLWNGGARPPAKPGGDRVDRYVIKARRGSHIAILEERDGHANLTLEVPGGVSATLSQERGGKLTVKAAGHTITLDAQGITLNAKQQKVSVSAGQVNVKASQVTVNAAQSTFSGVVKCDTLEATTVKGTTYTPGAGNLW